VKNIQAIVDILEASLDEETQKNITEGNIIKLWYDNQIDNYRVTIQDSHAWLSSYQAQLIKGTGINSLKIKYTNASWYFIEISKSQIWNITDDFIHKQTLVNASRYVTQDLSQFQGQLFEAQDTMAQREYEIFQQVRETVLDRYDEMKQVSKKTAYIDFLSSLWYVAYKNNYTCPKIESWYEYCITWWRHPVIESIESNFIDNDLELKNKDFVHVITWPNMWWKSTFLRQNALLVLMTHMWSYIPVKVANIGLTDKIFSRVWANDNLFLGKSTFMVEMQEVSHIVNSATDRSFIIIDEVWRGTSTYDGMSLAWWILKYIHDTLKAKTLFATHYHEIIDESQVLTKVSNYSVAVGENSDNLVFLRKVIPWGIKKSYGLEVAKLAGVKESIIREAKSMIERHQDSWKFTPEQLSFTDWNPSDPHVSWLEDKIESLEIDSLTPLEAFQILVEMKNITEKE